MPYFLLISIASLLLFGSCQSQKHNLADAHISRGNALADKGDFDGAIAEFSKAIAINPNQPYYYFNRGNVRKDKGDFDGAISDYDKAMSIDANIPEVYDNRGVARHAKEDWDGALSDFNNKLTSASKLTACVTPKESNE